MIYDKFYNGIQRSKNEQNGFDNLVNLDVHTSIGEAQCQLELISESTTPNEPCIQAEDTAGNIYFFSTTSGKTWKRAVADAAYTLVNTNANGAHAGCIYFNGYIYYATSTKLGRFNLVATWADSFATFTNGSIYKPMCELNLSLFIGDGKYVASVDNTNSFSDNALDILPQYNITALSSSGYDLLVWTTIGTKVKSCKVFLWDTYSPSWTVEDDIPENGVNCVIPADGITFVQCGDDGWLYYWAGSSAKRFFKLKDVDTVQSDQNSTVHSGRPLFATGTKIFSIHRESDSYPYAVVQEYTATQGTIKSIRSTGGQLLVSNGTNIDKIGTSYATATIDTPEADTGDNIFVDYHSIGSGGTVGISTNIDNGGYSSQTTITDTIKKKVYFDGGLGQVNFFQGRITLTPSGSNNIVIKRIKTN